MRKRTASQQMAAVQQDRRAKYEAKMRERGFKRTTVWIREDRLAEFKALIQRINRKP